MSTLPTPPVPTSNFRHPRGLILGIVVAGLACTDPTAPVPPVGTYALEAYAGHALPVVTFENAVQRITLVADTLILEPGGTGVRILRQRHEPVSGGPATEVRVVRDLKIVARGAALRVQEDVVCLSSHVSETCADLWDSPVSVGGGTLQVGPRSYAHVVVLLAQ